MPACAVQGHHHALLAAVTLLLMAPLAAQPAATEQPPADRETPRETAQEEEVKPQIGRMGEPVTVDPDEFEFSEAETLLWLSDHLANVTEPSRLRYIFSKTSSLEESFDDTVTIDVRQFHDDGSKSVLMKFFSGDREQQPQRENVQRVRGNPVLAIYLQGDVQDLDRLTGGHWRYFQRRIKLAFANSAVIEDVQVDYNGGKVEARKITIRPFTDDPKRARYNQFANKMYEFVLADDVPGTLYQVRTMVAGADGSTLVEEVLTFAESKQI